MKSRRFARTRLRVEELEARVVLSTLPGFPSYLPSLIAHSSLATTSTNWAGYATQSNLNSPANNVVTAVSGSWTVPAVTGSPGATAYSSVWIGIDGYTSSTVEQIGTESDWSDGSPVYYAWYEMYPQNSVTVTKLSVKPDDSVSASVTFASGKFTLAITDTSTKQSFSTVQAVAGAQRSSAEWIVEAPSSNDGVLPLADFGTTTISNASATITTAGKSTAAAINGAGRQSASINIVTQANAVAATTGGLTDSAGKSSFAVSYTAPAAASAPTPTHHHHGWWSVFAGAGDALGTGVNGGAVGRAGSPSDTSLAATPPSRLLPTGAATGPNLTPAPILSGFRAFGLGEDAPVFDDLDMPMPAPRPNRAVPPVIVPPAAADETALIAAPPTASPETTPAPLTPETPSERRDLRAGDVRKTLLAVFGVAGIIAFGGETAAPGWPSDERAKKPRQDDGAPPR